MIAAIFGDVGIHVDIVVSDSTDQRVPALASGPRNEVVAKDGEGTMVKVGLHARVVAKPGKEAEVEALLAGAVSLAEREPETLVWFAVRTSKTEFGIFDAFRDESGREAHLRGAIAAALMARADELLAEPPQIVPVDVLAAKLP